MSFGILHLDVPIIVPVLFMLGSKSLTIKLDLDIIKIIIG